MNEPVGRAGREEIEPGEPSSSGTVYKVGNDPLPDAQMREVFVDRNPGDLAYTLPPVAQCTAAVNDPVDVIYHVIAHRLIE